MKMDRNTTIIDVRTPGEFADRHVPGALNIPLDEIAQSIDRLKGFPMPIVAYCRSGNRSGRAVSILKQNGITEAMNGGGMDDLLQSIK